MKKNTKKYLKTNLIGFIIGGLLISGVAVYAAITFPSNEVSYDNSTSGLKSTNVQGAIDELYTTCFPPFTIGGKPVDIVTTGDGLYEDEYEEGKYTYKGANPNNYVTFNNETAGWRIISINSDGTIKIMRDASIGEITWDSSNSNNWNRPASLNTYLNGTYYNSLASTAKSQIVQSSYYAGKVTQNNNDMQDQINDEKSVVSNVKIALPTASEYIRACSNTSCKTFSTYNNNYSTCKNSDWMYNSDNWWILSPLSNSSGHVFYVLNSGNVHYNIGGAGSVSHGVRPVVTLSSEVQITGGDGTKSNPYILG